MPLMSALLAAGIVVTASAAAMTLGPATDTDTTTTTGTGTGASIDALSSPDVTPSATSRGSDERASRGGIRELTASSAPTSAPPATPATPAPAPSTRKPTPPAGGGSVTSTGTCGASYYTDGERTANGEWFNTNDFTAAHRTLPFNTRVRVTNTGNGKSTVVRINDRGPFVSGRCLDLTRAAFTAIASITAGVITVKYEVLSS
jgi:rare lipoprotein A